MENNMKLNDKSFVFICQVQHYAVIFVVIAFMGIVSGAPGHKETPAKQNDAKAFGESSKVEFNVPYLFVRPTSA